MGKVTNGVVYGENVLVVNSSEGLEKLLEKYHCKNIDELDELLWFNNGIVLIDRRI